MSDIPGDPPRRGGLDLVRGAAMAIEVRCGCGQLVYAEEQFAGQNVQCPHCKASVAVPVATAAAAPPARPGPPRRSL